MVQTFQKQCRRPPASLRPPPTHTISLKMCPGQGTYRSHRVIATQQLFGQVFDVLVLGRRHLQVVALLVEVFQYLVDVFLLQLALGRQHQVEGMHRFAEYAHQTFGYAFEAIALEHVQVHAGAFGAAVDGANTLQLFYRIALPISWPVFLTTGLVVGLAVWNEFLFALTFVHDDTKKPIATILFAFQSRFENNWGLVNASAVMMMAPIVILFMFFQRRFIAGLTSGASKG